MSLEEDGGEDPDLGGGGGGGPVRNKRYLSLRVKLLKRQFGLPSDVLSLKSLSLQSQYQVRDVLLYTLNSGWVLGATRTRNFSIDQDGILSNRPDITPVFRTLDNSKMQIGTSIPTNFVPNYIS